MSASSSSLLTIVAHARSGALDHAWRLFRQAGLEAVDDDPAVLSLRGRLLKDQALAVGGAPGQDLYRQAADAYGRAGAISGATYPLINAATLALLAGDASQSQRRARDVLARLEVGEAEPDTPYYRAATRAEALLLLGDRPGAQAALDEAVALAPRAWEDHASTLHQFERILSAQGADSRWLDTLRPPRSLHFGGHIAVDIDDRAAPDAIAALLEAEGVGFGFGALAAGADVMIAEALLARGAELHLTLSSAPPAFRASSVAAMGERWAARFDAILARADSVRWFGHPGDEPGPLGIQLAGEAAMGAAWLQARTLASEAVQLLVLDPEQSGEGEAGGSAWMADVWRATGDRQHQLHAPRAGRSAPLRERVPAALAAVLLVEIDGADGSLAEAGRLATAVLPVLADRIDRDFDLLAAPSWRGGSVQLAFRTPAEAAKAALDISAGLTVPGGLRIAAAYGPVPLDGDRRACLLGATAATATAVMDSVSPGAIHVTEAFAMALLASPDRRRVRIEYVGDLPTLEVERPERLFSLKAAAGV